MYYQYANMLPELARFVPKLGQGHRVPTAEHRCGSCQSGRTGKGHEVSGLDRFKAATFFLPDGKSMPKKERERVIRQFLAEAVRTRAGQNADAETSILRGEAFKKALEEDHDALEEGIEP